MDLSHFGFAKQRNTVVLLGAGATRGASFVKPFHTHKPPLDIDFFTQLRASGRLSQRAEVERLLKFVMEEFGTLETSMERFYTEATISDEFVGMPAGKGRPPVRYKRAVQDFRTVLPSIFGATIGSQGCRYHATLATLLTPKDAVISFNYDCLIDHTLRQVAGSKWDPSRGYGFPIASGAADWRTQSGRGRPPKGTIQLLKLHGSLNWHWQADALHLHQNAYRSRPNPDDLMIVPPLWQKRIADEPFKSMWIEARRFLASTKALIVVGYSLPETDMFTSALLRTDVQELDFLMVVNPDDEARSRVKAALTSAMTSQTFVVEMQNLEHVHDWLTRGGS